MHPSQARLLIALATAAIPAAAYAQNSPPAPALFPFVLPWDDASKTITDVSSLNPAPIDESRRVVLRGNQFADGTGRRVKFLGANFTFGANFPDKADAEKVAARMHKLGFNAVRLHHMDGPKAPRGIWDPKFDDLQHVDAGQLDRLDYLVSQFSKNGIYVDLNLHVARRFGPGDGFPDTDKLAHNGKITAWFEPKMVELQKKFARDLLSHRNPYTGYTWAQDPAVALIEIHNEDTLVGSARSGELQQLPPYYRDQVIAGWNTFLKAKYHTTEGMLAAWNQGLQPIGDNLIKSGRFPDTAGWSVEQHDPAQGSITPEDITGPAPAPGRALHLKTTQVDTQPWHLQLNYPGMDLQDGQNYTVSFWARASEARRLTVYTKMDQAPWQDIGLRESVPLTTAWKKFNFSFKAKAPLPNHSRLTFVMGDIVGDVWIADVSLRADGAFELGVDQSLEKGNIELLTPSVQPWGQDFTAYLMDVEAKFAVGMKDYIQKDLGARGLVTCSQANFGGFSGVMREFKMDFVDTHAYWQHPRFPGRAWDMNNWIVENRAMVANARYGTLPGLAMHRVANKPFTVTEYNHPAPNAYSAETLPMIVAYANWQDWDGVFLFEYATGSEWKSDKIKSFFTSDSHPGKMIFVPAMARLFLGGQNATPLVTKTLLVPIAQATVLGAEYPGMKDLWMGKGMGTRDAVGGRLKVTLADGITEPGVATAMASARVNGRPVEFEWKVDDPLTGSTFSYMSNESRVAVINCGQNQRPQLNGWTFVPAPTGRPFAALALAAMDGKAVEQSASLVLAAAGDVQNLNMGWNADHTSVGTKWGNGPTQVEGIAGKVSFKTTAQSAQVFALDGTGKRLGPVPVTLDGGQINFEIGPQYKTLWYEIAAAQ